MTASGNGSADVLEAAFQQRHPDPMRLNADRRYDGMRADRVFRAWLGVSGLR